MIFTFSVSKELKDFCYKSAVGKHNYSVKNGLHPWYGGGIEEIQQGLICERKIDLLCDQLHFEHTTTVFDPGIIQQFDKTIKGKRYEIKSGACMDVSQIGHTGFCPQVQKDQYDAGRGKQVFGYIFPFINRDLSIVFIRHWIKSEDIPKDRSGRSRSLRTWEDKTGKPHQSYIIPFIDTLPIETL